MNSGAGYFIFGCKILEPKLDKTKIENLRIVLEILSGRDTHTMNRGLLP
jgi:hypothetical protein